MLMGECMGFSLELKQKILDNIPQKPPFRFIEDILEISDKHIIGKYTYKEDEFFYEGHFPGRPITPGVIILETMAQTGVVALGIYLSIINQKPIDNQLTLFTEAQVEFNHMVLPGESIEIRGDLIYYRKNKIKTKVEVKKGDILVALGELAGVGIER